MARLKGLGILGGTFNPVHLGHLVLAEQARELLNLKKIMFVPTNIRPYKSVKTLASAQERYHMLNQAIKGNPYFETSNFEINKGGVSYSVETVKQFRQRYRNITLYFIIGSDFLEEFSIWKDLDKIGKICKFVIAQRPGHPIRKFPLAAQKLLKRIQTITISSLDISSSDIRNRIKRNKTIRYLVPGQVRKYIVKNKLYR